jgi:superfamily II DNA or RNA helicase
MKLTISHPSKAYVEASQQEMEELNRQLTFTNTSIAHDVKRLYNNFWLRSKNEAKWQETLDNLKRRAKRTLVFEDDQGTYIHPGSIPYLSDLNVQIENNVKYPLQKKVAWKKQLPFQLHQYQEDSWQRLLEVKHGNVELCTGSGKSAIILKICRETGFRTAIIAPSKSIFNELLTKFEYHFGKDKVGAFGAGKKRLGKQFTVCISDSICNIELDTAEWTFFSELDCILVDESHTFGAETLEEICYGVLADVPYRMFFSGTQTRNDGGEKLLESIIGKTVNVLTTKQAVEGGFICPHEYRIVDIESSNPNYNDQDVLMMKRAHYLKNRNICAFVAKLANAEAITRRRQTLVLVEELEQISMLLPLLRVPTAMAHSEKKADRLQELGLEKVDPNESVEKFNKGEALVLVGTSCISTGTNIYPVHNCVNWAGGASEIRTKQGAIGRSVRLHSQNPWADKCTVKDKAIIWDFNIHDCHIMKRHLEERMTFYQESGSEIKHVKLGK